MKSAIQTVIDFHRQTTTGKSCPKCQTPMRPGIALAQTWTSSGPDELGGDVVTMSAGGPGVVVDCHKCPECGHSVTL